MPRTVTKRSGFTLVEVLIISPVVILFIGVFIGLLVSLTGESLVIRERNVAVYDTQAALDEIETTVSQATGFLVNTNGITISSPQGKNDTNAAFTNTNGAGEPETLIVKSAATTKRSTDPTRALIYMGSGACNSANPAYEYLTVYFVALDPDTTDTTDKALYKRTILPQFAACATPYQKGSCTASLVASNPTVCKASDEKLVSGVSTLDVSYFIGASTTAAADTEANSATDVAISLDLAKKIAGSDVTHSASSRTNSSNVQSSGTSGIGGGGTTATAPANPAVQWSRNNTGATPYRTTVTWGTIGNAVNYTVKYRLNSGAEQSITVGQSATPSTNIDAAHRKQTIQLVDILVNTSSGSFSYGPMPSITAIPNWNDCTFSGQGAWNNYGAYYGSSTYTTAGYTKTSSKLVGLKGLVKGTTLNVPICTLPEGFRPKFAGEKLIFQVPSANGANWGRIDVHPNGDVVPVQGNTEWFSLDGIIFAADDSTYTWTNRVWEYGWYWYGTGHSTLRSTTDNQGRIHIQGLGGYSGTSPNGNVMTNVLTGPNRTLHVPAMSVGPGIVQVNGNGWVLVRSSPTNYQQIQLMYRPAGATGWQNMPFSSNWTNYDVNNWPTMQCHRGSDDVIIIQGLIAHPGGGNGTYIGDTGPCGRFSSGKGIGVEDRLLMSPWLSNETTGRVDFINGVSLLSQGTQDPWTALDGMHFIAD